MLTIMMLRRRLLCSIYLTKEPFDFGQVITDKGECISTDEGNNIAAVTVINVVTDKDSNVVTDQGDYILIF